MWHDVTFLLHVEADEIYNPGEFTIRELTDNKLLSKVPTGESENPHTPSFNPPGPGLPT